MQGLTSLLYVLPYSLIAMCVCVNACIDECLSMLDSFLCMCMPLVCVWNSLECTYYFYVCVCLRVVDLGEVVN